MRWLFGTAILAVVPLVFCSSCGPPKPKGPPPSKFKSLIKEDIKVGTGEEASDDDMALIQYIGRYAKDDSLFDTNDPEMSEKNKNPLPIEIRANAGVIDGMWQGVKGMKVGGERKVSVPWNLGYGATGSDTIPPYSDLVFTVKLLYVVKVDEKDLVQVEDLKLGSGEELKEGVTGEFSYKGTLANGRVFDDTSTYTKKAIFTIGKKQVISGLEQGVLGMKVGGRRRVTIPPAGAWGVYGNSTIPGNQVLVFDITLVRTVPAGTK